MYNTSTFLIDTRRTHDLTASTWRQRTASMYTWKCVAVGSKSIRQSPLCASVACPRLALLPFHRSVAGRDGRRFLGEFTAKQAGKVQYAFFTYVSLHRLHRRGDFIPSTCRERIPRVVGRHAKRGASALLGDC